VRGIGLWSVRVSNSPISIFQRMLNRRDLFKAGFAAAASAGALTAVGNAPAMAATPSKIADMTHTVSDQFPTYFGTPGISMDQKFNFKENGFNLFEMSRRPFR